MRGQRFLILVESPTKAKTLRKFLGKEYEVKATLGHVKDLPLRGLGVDLESFSPSLVFLRGKRKLLERLASYKGSFFIATDPDREGERIAFDIWEFLKSKGVLAKRVEFHEITPAAVREALSSPGEINLKRVKAALTRRVLDRLYGYIISPFLWKGLKIKGLSAGRVQSCALKIIVDREREREKFVSETWYELKVVLSFNGANLEVKLWNLKEDVPLRLSKEEADRLKRELKGALKLESLECKEVLIPPPPPFKTATLLEKASSLLRLSSERTMREAQELFERGYITYHRTDSCFLSEKAINMALSFIRGNFGESYASPRRYEREGAHEAIRPTDVNVKGISPLYDLIWRYFVASQMAPAKVLRERAIFLWKDKVFVSWGERVVFDGWTSILKREFKGDLGPLKEGEFYKLIKVSALMRKSHPPPRYTEATLIRELERKGVGRPSTYAMIISNLLKRRYVVREKRFLVPTELGLKVCSFLEDKLGDDLLSPVFTSDMEAFLDKIESDGEENFSFLREFYNFLLSKISSA